MVISREMFMIFWCINIGVGEILAKFDIARSCRDVGNLLVVCGGGL